MADLYEPLAGGDLLKIRLRRVCAWHPGGPLVLDEGDPGAPETHGMCPDCAQREREALRAKRAAQAREAERIDRLVDAGIIPAPPPTCTACNSRPASLGLRCAICEAAERIAAVDAAERDRERVEHDEECRFCRSMRGQPAPLGGLRALCARLNGRTR